MDQEILIAHKKSNDYGLKDKLKNICGQEYSIRAIDDLSQLCFAFDKSMPELIILDLDINPSDKKHVLKTVNKIIKGKDIPIILFSSFESDKYLAEVFEFEVQDYINHTINEIELKLRINAIFQRKILQSKIQKQRNQLNEFALVADRSGNSIVIINKSGEIEWANEGFVNLYGYKFDNFLKKFGSNVIESDFFNTTTRENFQKCLRKGETVSYTNTWKTKGGIVKWIRTTLSPVTDDNGISIKVIAIESDFTEVKRVERTLEEKNKHLLSLADHLEHSNKLLEQKNYEIESQKIKSDELLFNIFPKEVANQLKRKGEAKTKLFRMTSVLFADFKGFSALTKLYSVKDLIKELSSYFEEIDNIVDHHFLEKIKTMGDAYMCVGGVPFRNNSNPLNAVMAGLEIQNFMREDMLDKRQNNMPIWQLRIGIHTGEVIAGVIGRKKFAYDIWGDTVNTASRMESGGEVGKVNISGDTYEYVKDYFECTHRGKIRVKKSVEMDMYYVERLKAEFAEDEGGVFPNAAFRKILATF